MFLEQAPSGELLHPALQGPQGDLGAERLVKLSRSCGAHAPPTRFGQHYPFSHGSDRSRELYSFNLPSR